MITVETITFNHDRCAATHDALNIRRNASQTVHVPEWRRFISVNPEDSPAVYAVITTSPTLSEAPRGRRSPARNRPCPLGRVLDDRTGDRLRWPLGQYGARGRPAKAKIHLRGNTKGKGHSRPRAAAGDRARSADYDAAIG